MLDSTFCSLLSIIILLTNNSSQKQWLEFLSDNHIIKVAISVEDKSRKRPGTPLQRLEIENVPDLVTNRSDGTLNAQIIDDNQPSPVKRRNISKNSSLQRRLFGRGKNKGLCESAIQNKPSRLLTSEVYKQPEDTKSWKKDGFFEWVFITIFEQKYKIERRKYLWYSLYHHFQM